MIRAPEVIKTSTSFHIVILAILAAAWPRPAQAQVVKGVVWDTPSNYREAAQDLVEMHAVGVEAVRTGLILDERILSIADSLGLTFYRELPFVRLTARALSDSLAQADSLVSLLLEGQLRHLSAGPIGLAQFSNTASERACIALDRLAVRIQQAGGQAYYSSHFIEDDLCSSSMDFVLIDGLDTSDPLALLTRWGAAHSTPAGFARVGVFVTDAGARGWERTGSVEFQARFFEDLLGELEAASVSRIFIHRWRDQTRMGSLQADLYGRKYGLYTREAEPRPALQVVRGFFLGTQSMFAFLRAGPEEELFPWFLLLGWILLTMVAVMYTGSSPFRSMIPRYFFSHGFFRNAVREAREVLPLTSTAMLTLTGLSIGLIASFVLTELKETMLAQHLFFLLPDGGRVSVTSILDAPFVLAILMGSVALVAMSLWMGLWMVVSGRRAPLLPSQALMLAVWPRWQVILLLPLAMTLASAEAVPTWSILLLAAAWIGTAYWSSIRTSYDLFKITSIPLGGAVLVWLLNPLILGTMSLLGWAVMNTDETIYIWNLVVRS